jgi:Transposase
MKEQSNRSEFTIGLDLGERRHRFCVLNGKGEVVEEATLGNDRASLARLTARYRGVLAVMEAGAHSPWVSRHLEGLGWEVIVSNPRKVRAIYQHERKSDRRDALMLARIGRMAYGPQAFHAYSHGYLSRWASGTWPVGVMCLTWAVLLWVPVRNVPKRLVWSIVALCVAFAAVTPFAAIAQGHMFAEGFSNEQYARLMWWNGARSVIFTFIGFLSLAAMRRRLMFTGSESFEMKSPK